MKKRFLFFYNRKKNDIFIYLQQLRVRNRIFYFWIRQRREEETIYKCIEWWFAWYTLNSNRNISYKFASPSKLTLQDSLSYRRKSIEKWNESISCIDKQMSIDVNENLSGELPWRRHSKRVFDFQRVNKQCTVRITDNHVTSFVFQFHLLSS